MGESSLQPDSSVQDCLKLLKRFLLCPICLDDLQNPLITPCAHVFCKYCIHKHVGKKVQSKCPLCNRDFTRRSLKASEKFTTITRACESVIRTYENETSSSVMPGYFPSEQLHLSQELSQRAHSTDEIKSKRESGSLSTLRRGNSRRNRTEDVKKPRNTPRSRVVLGSLARISQTGKIYNTSVPLISDDPQSTQPMRESDVVTEAVELDQDLFTLTQQTQPMTCNLEEFSPVEGMGSRQDEPDFTTKEVIAKAGNIVARNDHKLPPLPPGPSKRKAPHASDSRKRLTDSQSIDMPLKHCKIESSVTECTSLSGVLRKTHEVMCRVQPSTYGLDSTMNHETDLEVTASPAQQETEHDVRESRRSLLLWYRKRTRSRSSQGSSHHPQKTRWKSMNSPGWCRWRSMSRDLKPRRSSLSLRFRSASSSRASAQSNSLLDSESLHSLRVSKPNRFGKRSQKLSSSTVSLPNMQHRGVIDEPAPTKSKPCNFVLPLRRLFTKRSRSSLSLNKPPLVFLKPTDKTSIQVSSTNEKRLCKLVPTIECADSVASSVVSTVDASCEDSIIAEPCLQCSACGETLKLDSENLSLLTSPAARKNTCRTPQSCSPSFRQADDPGLSSMSDLNLEKMVHINQASMRKDSAHEVANVGCQTSFDSEPQQAPSMGSEIPQEVIPKTQCDPGDSSPIPSTPQSTINDQLICSTNMLTSAFVTSDNGSPRDTVRLASSPDAKSLSEATAESPDELECTNFSSTCQPSSGEIMPTIERERLRSECNELEAVVAALQQQLEAQVGGLSPNATAELLRAAGTEPLEDDETTFNQDALEATTGSNRMTGHDIQSSSQIATSMGSTVTTEKCANRTQLLNEGVLNSQVPEQCSSDGPDVIPSSQQEEDEVDQLDPSATCSLAPSEITVLTATPVLGSNTQSNRVVRVDPSQPSIPVKMTTVADESLPQSDSQLLRHEITLTAVSTELTECPETNLDTQSSRMRDLTQVQKSKVPISIMAATGSNLTANQKMLLRSFCRHFNIAEHSQFIPGKTTHIVIAPESDRPRVVKRTLKYFLGILNGAWIVNTDWMCQCLAAGLVLDETPFEIEGDTVCGDSHEGPRRGRLRVPAQPSSVISLTRNEHTTGTGPFSGLWLCAYAGLGLLSVPEFMSLALDGGASRVFEKPADLAVAADQFVMSQSAPTRPRAVILTNHSPPDFDLKKCEKIYKEYGIPIISIEWMLNCISLYRRIPISEGYRICPAATQHPRYPLTSLNQPR